jgi:Ribonuclease G/E
MRARALVEARPGETRAAVLDTDGALLDVLVLRDDTPEVVGGQYLGRVTAFDPGLQAAFVDIGLARPALLPKRAAKGRLNQGDSVVVEVVRAPATDKGAKVTARVVEPPAAEGVPPRLLRAADPLAGMMERHDPSEIVVDGIEVRGRLQRRLSGLADRFSGYTGAVPLFAVEGLDAELDALLDPDVPLPGGGLLRIEPVRTLTAIDVDAGAREARGGVGRMALELDLAAAAEIARQICLRALSGLIVIDFLELAEKAARQQVTDALKAALPDADVGPMRASGLAEVTRRRVRTPLHELLAEPCGRGGGGYVKTAMTVAFELLRDVCREAAANPGRAVSVVAAPSVAAALDGAASEARKAAERALGRPLACRADPTRPRESYEILLG